MFILSHYILSQQQQKYVELNMPVKSVCYNCKETFSTLKLLEDYTETKHPDHYAKASNTTVYLKTVPAIHAIQASC